jgi:hypothetical protein
MLKGNTTKRRSMILTRRERLLQLVILLLVEHSKPVEVLRATDLEIFPSCSDNEIFDLVDLLRLWVKRQRTKNTHRRPLENSPALGVAASHPRGGAGHLWGWLAPPQGGWLPPQTLYFSFF